MRPQNRQNALPIFNQKNMQPVWLYKKNQFYASQAFDVKRTTKIDGTGPFKSYVSALAECRKL